MDLLKRFWTFRKYFGLYKGGLFLVGCLVVATTLVEGAGVGLLYPLIEYVQMGDAYLERGRTASMVAAVLRALGLAPSVEVFISLIFGVIAGALALRYALWLASAKVFNPLARRLREDAFAEILHSHVFYFYDHSSAELVNTIESEADYLSQSINLIVTAATHAVSVAVYVAMLMLVSWKLTIVVAALGAIRYAVAGGFVRRVHRISNEFAELRTRLKSYLIGIHQGIDVVKSCGAEETEEARFSGLNDSILKNAYAAARVNADTSLAEGLLGDSLLCLLVYIAVSVMKLPMAALLSFLFVNTRIIPKITAINAARIQIVEYLSRLLLLPEILFGAGLPRISWGQTPKESFEDKVVFEGVSFSYPGSKVPSLSSVSFTLRKGETLALVGESGSGKSTLARLLLRLFEPTSGRVEIDGQPLGQLRRQDWTRLLSVVSQDTFLFDDTLENNIKYGAPACTEEQFWRAVKLANAEDFVRGLPQKEKTPLGERGVKLSGGQRQRVAIARAFLRDSPILILDEATSAMDAQTERQIQEALDRLAAERTLLVIAHRFGTIRGADRIMVLSQGKVVETGKHEELLGKDGVYRKFHDLQALT